MKRLFLQKYQALNFNFYQNINDFVVTEIPLRFSNRGNFIVLKVKKVNLSTWDLIEKISKSLNIYEHEIGYAGLKDKNATTTQYISIPKKYSKELKRIKHGKIEILETYLHFKKIEIGDLVGNHFEINLHNVRQEEFLIIEQRVKEVISAGMPNYFGFQRFGKDVKENLQKAKQLVNGELRIKDKKLEKMLIFAYQSDLFNKWLAKRIELSKDEFKLLNGDVFIDLSSEKYFTPKQLDTSIIENFKAGKIAITGLLCGKNAFRSLGESKAVEEKFDDFAVAHKGSRRVALVNPTDININYNKEEKKCKLCFSLPKTAYATVLIENIKGKNLF